MAYCANCGNVLGAGDRFCAVCGTPAAIAARPAPRRTFWSRWGMVVVAGVGLFLALLVVSAMVTPTRAPEPDVAIDTPFASPVPTLEPTAAPTPAPTFARPTGVLAAAPTPPDDATHATVVKVTDGDTIVLDGIGVGAIDRPTGGRKTRLIGVDTPEVFGGSECFGAQASAFTKRELDGAAVLVDFDVETTDRFGRALAYVWTPDGAFFNARLVAEGYASQLTIPPNVRYADLFLTLARQAREAARGLWSACDEPEPAAAVRPVGPASSEGPPPSEPPSGGRCDPSYPDFCIPPPPPDLDCDDIPQKNFTVRQPDPHGFDGRDNDGRGCES